MRSKSLILLAVALGCGLMASIGINQVLATKNNQQQAPAVETTPILVAVSDIPMGEKLREETVKIEEWPKEKVPDDALTSLEEAANRITRTRILKDEPIRLGRLGSGDTAEELIPNGYRVIAVRVDSSTGGANLILPGNRVDVLIYLRRNPGLNINESGTRTILEDVKVFAVNDVFRHDSLEGEGTIAAKTISLLVTPEQAERIALASELGKLRLTMRSPTDDTAAAPPGSDVATLFDQEKSNREEEAGDLPTDGDERQSGSRDDLLALLNRQEKEPEPAAPAIEAEPAPALFAMVLIEGPEARIVEFEEGKDLPLALRGSVPPAGAPAGAPAPSAAPAAVPPLPAAPPTPAPAGNSGYPGGFNPDDLGSGLDGFDGGDAAALEDFSLNFNSSRE